MPKRVRIVSVPSDRAFPYEEGDSPIVADHVAEAWTTEGTAEPYSEPRESATRSAPENAAQTTAPPDYRVEQSGSWYTIYDSEDNEIDKVQGSNALEQRLAELGNG